MFDQSLRRNYADRQVTARAFLGSGGSSTWAGRLLCWLGLHDWCDKPERYTLADMTRIPSRFLGAPPQVYLEVVYLRRGCARPGCTCRGYNTGAAVYVREPGDVALRGAIPDRPTFVVGLL